MREDSPERFARMVLVAIARGSTLTSPFIHTTRDLQVARKWKNLGRERRQDENYLVRIRRSMLQESCIVDMSTKHRQDSSSGSSSKSIILAALVLPLETEASRYESKSASTCR